MKATKKNNMQSKTAYPDVFARFYDTIYSKLRQDDHEYYLKKINNCKGKVLEAGVGTGRFFLEAINDGADIFGIDISPSMIKKLKMSLAPEMRERIKVQDICNFQFDFKFDLIIAPFRIFSHLLTVQEQQKALLNIANYLHQGGLFIFDLYIPDPLMIANGLNEFVDFEGEYQKGLMLKRTTSMYADIVNQLSYIKMKFDWQENNKWLSESWNIQMRFYFRYEIEHLIALSPLKLENIFGNFNEKPIDTGDKEMIIVCSKN